MMEEQLLNLLQKVRDDGDEAARTELNELLRKHPEARTIMSRTLVNEHALVSHLRDESIVSILDAEPEVAAIRPSAMPARRLVVSHAAPIELGGFFVDDVQLTAIRRPNLPVHFVN